MGTIIRAGDCYTQEQVVFNTAIVVGLTTANYAPTTGVMKGQIARSVLINLETNDIRYHVREPIKTASTGNGMLFIAGDYLILDSPSDIQMFNGLNTSKSTSTAVVFYYA